MRMPRMLDGEILLPQQAPEAAGGVAAASIHAGAGLELQSPALGPASYAYADMHVQAAAAPTATATASGSSSQYAYAWLAPAAAAYAPLPVILYRKLHRGDYSKVGIPNADGQQQYGFPLHRKDQKGSLWELLPPDPPPPPGAGSLHFVLMVRRKYRLALASPRPGVLITLAASLSGDPAAGALAPTVPEPQLLSFEGFGKSASEDGWGRPVQTAELKLNSRGLSEGGFGFASSTQALGGVCYELSAVYADTGLHVAPVRILVSTRTSGPASTLRIARPAPPLCLLVIPGLPQPVPSQPFATVGGPSPQPAPYCFGVDPSGPGTPATPFPFEFPSMPPDSPAAAPAPPPPPATPASGAKSGGPGHRPAAATRKRVAGAGAERAAAAKSESDAAVLELADPFAALTLAMASEAASGAPPDPTAPAPGFYDAGSTGTPLAEPDRSPSSAGAAGQAPDHWMDQSIVASLERAFLKARDLVAGSSSPAEGSAELEPRPARRPRKASNAPEFDEAEELLRRIDCSRGRHGAPLDVAGARPAPGGALLEAARGRPPPPVFESPADRADFEAAFAEALEAVEAGSAAAAPILEALLAGGLVLCSRFLDVSEGMADFRRAMLALRAATGSVAAERRVAEELMQAAASAIIARADLPAPYLLEACERGWRLCGALVPAAATRATVQDLLLVPMADVIALAELAALCLQRHEREQPAAYAKATFELGLRNLQARRDEEAWAALYTCWGVVRRHELHPSRTEAHLVSCLLTSLASRSLFEDANKMADLLYWFDDSDDVEDLLLRQYCLETLVHVQIKQRKDASKAVRDYLGACLALPSAAADSAGHVFFAFCITAVSDLSLGHFVDAIQAYKRAVEWVADRPHLGSHPASDALSNRGSFDTADPAKLASGLRVAASLHRLVDWSGRTPLLGHILYSLGRAYAKAGDAGRALASFAECDAVYGRFRALYPEDHPRVLAVRRAMDACRGAPPAPS